MIARDGYALTVHGRPTDYASAHVTSGSPAPFLKKNIGMAYVPVRFERRGTPIEIGSANEPSRGRDRAAAILQARKIVPT